MCKESKEDERPEERQSKGEEATAGGNAVARTRVGVGDEQRVYGGVDLTAVFLEFVEVGLHVLVDRVLHLGTRRVENIFDLDRAAGVDRNVERRQLEGMGITHPRREVLGDLNNDLLPIALVGHRVRFGEEIPQLLRVLEVEALDDLHRAVAERLPDRIKEDVDEVDVLGDGEDGVFDGEQVLERAIHQPWRVDERDQREGLLLGRRHLSLQPVVDRRSEALELELEMGEEVHGGLPLESVTLFAARAEREALRLDCNRRALHVLADIPVDIRRLASAVVADNHYVDLAARCDARDAELVADGHQTLFARPEQRRREFGLLVEREVS
mmetsp:Transcript_5602/g.14830  ORF Transcript_5602/g.14830 Transcript_5602/m.14830 type:complete len:327 (-) Transcript_5602:115-1095(-)